jgi:hypothetical protein
MTEQLVNIHNEAVPEQRAFTLNLSNCDYDAWISEPISDDDVAWFQQEMGLSRDSLFRIFASAKDIVEQFKPNDEYLDLSYDVRGGWHIYFKRTDTNGRWNVVVYREEHIQ